MLALLPQFLLTGLTVGSVYALVALGFVLIYNVTGVLNFAQGEFSMLGALLCATLLTWHLSLGLAALLAVAAVCGIGALMERLAVEPAYDLTAGQAGAGHPLTLVIITFGVSMALRGLALTAWGADPHTLPEFTPGPALVLLGGVLVRQAIWAIGLSVVVVVALFVFFARTVPGAAVRACADNAFASRLVGISPRRMSLFAFTLAAGLGAVAGIVVAPMTGATYDMGLELGLKGFVAAVIGGLTNAPAAVVGGYIVGLIESLSTGYLAQGYSEAITFLVLLVVLVLQREGLLHGAARRRA
ncbi:MAG TPA: branched-chain amino acid ABC transporter permease [bacterium]|nr:branched-chain amino acid ABC transporter permease [bacterium]